MKNALSRIAFDKKQTLEECKKTEGEKPKPKERSNFYADMASRNKGPNWYLKLTKAEWSLEDRIVDSYAGDDYNESARYALKSEKRSTVFVVYSTDDKAKLFANSGDKAVLVCRMKRSIMRDPAFLAQKSERQHRRILALRKICWKR